MATVKKGIAPKKNEQHDFVARKIGANIKAAREDMTLTQAELARRLHHTTAWVANLEQARGMIMLPDLINLVNLSGKPLEYFFSGSGVQIPSVERPKSLGDWLRMYPGNEELAEWHLKLDDLAAGPRLAG